MGDETPSAGLGDGRQSSGQARAVRTVLLVVLAAALAYLLLGPKPWNSGIAARPPGHDVKVADYVVTFWWWATLGNSGLLALLLATLPRWLGGAPPPERPGFRGPAGRGGVAFAAAALGAVATLAVLAAPRLHQSLWDDEIQNLIRSIDGHYRREPDGTVTHRDVTWVETLWYYRQPNNHVPHTILARLATEGWRAWSGQEARRFYEPALRAPAFAAGLASAFALAWMLRRVGFPGAGLLASWLFVLHPWPIRYTSEARGYSIVLLLLSVILVLLWRALERGTWRRWLAWGTAQALLLWTNPGVVTWVAVLNLAALVLLWHGHRRTLQLRPQVLRWGVSCLLGAGVYLQLTAPMWPQVLEFTDWLTRSHEINAHWHADVAADLLAGTPWHQSPALGPYYPQLQEVAASWGAWFWVAVAAVLAGIAAGVVRLARRGAPGLALAAVFLVPGPITWAAATLTQRFIWEWYLLFALPGAIALLSLGCTWPAALRRRPLGLAAAALFAAGALAGDLALGADARATLRERSYQPLRESVALTRPLHDPDPEVQGRILTASFGRRPEVYDPYHVPIRTQGGSRAAVLRRLMEKSRRSGRPLYVNGTPLRLAKHDPELHHLLQAEFEEIALLHGFEPRLSRAVYRYRGTPSDAPRAGPRARREGATR